VQLIDAESGNHLWADRFDKTSGDLLQMQDEIVARVVASADAWRCQDVSRWGVLTIGRLGNARFTTRKD
jgi:hypothetical protein